MSKVGWFEIPVGNLDRAKSFYEAIFDIRITVRDMGPLKMGWLPDNNESYGANGTLVFHEEFYRPDAQKGVLIYFICADVQDILDRVEDAGGTIHTEKRQISPEVGYMGVFIDSEGNRIALHSKS